MTLAGLLANCFGAVFLALSFGRNLGDAYQNDAKGRKIYLASFTRPSFFKAGLALTAIGFVLQLIPEVQRNL